MTHMRIPIPNIERAPIPASVLAYLLCLDQPDCLRKAQFFARLGFSVANWPALAAALHTHAKANAASSAVNFEYGTKFIVDGPLQSPLGRSSPVRAVWIIEGAGEPEAPQFITAYSGSESER